jgi:hypothetical protein
MQIARPWVSAPRRKIRMYKRSQLRRLHEMREVERQEKMKLVKLRQRKFDYEWQLTLRRLESKEES